VDANLAPGHTLEATVGVFPNVSKMATLGTFTPPDATADLRANVLTTAVTERSVLGGALFAETTVEVNSYHTDVRPQGGAPMELLPDTTLGNFYNRHDRTTTTVQVIETLTGSAVRGNVLHLFKGGVDLLRNQYRSTSVSGPVLIRRPDGTLARRLDFGPASSQQVSSTDVALFAQDRMQPTNRWYVEFGGRLDRDGITSRWNVTPRIGSAVLLNASGTAVLRGGLGLFFERTPSAVGVFEQYESYTETRYAGDGVTPLGVPQTFLHQTAPGLRTPRSLTWDVAYDHRFNPEWSFHAGVIDRDGSHESIVEPIPDGADSRLVLSSTGESRYREAEIGVHFTRGSLLDLNASYVRSMARSDLNAFTTFFDSVRTPVLGESAYAASRSDTPHRLLVRWRAMPMPTWLLVGVADWRTGLPYSTVNEALDFVGPRNVRRFPDYVRFELGVEHRVRLGPIQPWVGVRAQNAFNAFLPADVQANVASPDFGRFYNSEYRQFRIQLRFGR
jgi:hypothetical protein